MTFSIALSIQKNTRPLGSGVFLNFVVKTTQLKF